MTSFVFLGPKNEREDSNLFLGNETFFHIKPTDTTLAHLLFTCGKFPSIKEAKRNGWNKPVPSGWNEYRIGSGRNLMEVVVWNPSTLLSDWED